MTNFLQSILGIDNPLFEKGVETLEKSTGNSGIDTRLIADITEKAHRVMRSIDLDPADTTAKELYHTLTSAIRDGDVELLLGEMDYVMLAIEGNIISFNLIDVIENYHHEIAFEDRIFNHGQRSLRGEFFGRYIDHARTDKSTTIEIASSIGLLLENEYNNTNAYQRNSKETAS